jgi:hypothetical protein
LTLSAAPVNGRKLVVYSVAAGVSGSNLNIDTMTGDGSDTTLTLSINPVNENNSQVFIDGVYQNKSTYSISGTTLTFSAAPPNGSAVEVMTMTQTEVNVPVDGTITSAKLSGALTTPSTLVATGKITADAGIDIDNINIDGTTIALSSGDLTLDVASSITLDSDSGVIDFDDGGVNIGRIENSSSDFKFESRVQDKDILFVGNDGGSGITALKLDMSDAGEAILNSGIRVGELRVHANQITSGFNGDGEDRDVWINYTGYAGGTTRFRDFRVGNGKQGQLLFVDGSAASVAITGSLSVSSSVSKGSGSFKIDHPLPAKTETHHLVHSFIEGPQADNIYRGKIDLVDGSATVNIDTAAGMTEGTYVLLNTNTQCFTSNESGWTAVKGSVSGNNLTITAQESCSDTISWMVIGERHDQHMLDTEWTDDNGKVIVEPLKLNEEE